MYVCLADHARARSGYIDDDGDDGGSNVYGAAVMGGEVLVGNCAEGGFSTAQR